MSEADILQQIVPHLTMGPEVIVGPGDDAAVSHWDADDLVVSTDMLVEGHDFKLNWSNAHEIGRKAIAQNLADIAAMGARPTQVVVATAAPSGTDTAWLAELARGMREYAARWGVSIVGGDLSAAPQVVISVAVYGDMQGNAPVVRSGAQAGDVIALAGPVGCSGLGLDLLRGGFAGAEAHIPDEVRPLVKQLINWHCAPEPPISMGVIAAASGATAMIDISDGLWEDAGRIAAASSQRIGLSIAMNLHSRRLDYDAGVLAPAARLLERDAYDWILGGGEDHSLLATFPATVPLPQGFREIGQVVPVVTVDQMTPLVLLDGQLRDVVMFDHFRG